MGPNGSGKTTLLRILLGEEEPDSGTVQRGHLVEFGYYDQHLQDAAGRQAGDPRRLAGRRPRRRRSRRMRDLLGRFGLIGDQVYQQVGELSGGEKSRAALARLVAQGVNVLVLDEPTNHLDLWACDALEQALLEFEGTVHRRQPRPLLPQPRRRPAAGAGRRRQRAGDPRQLRHLRADARPADRNAKSESRKPKEARAASDERASTRERQTQAEVPLSQGRGPGGGHRRHGDGAAGAGTSSLASPELYRDGERVKKTTQAFEETKAKLQQLYEHWEEAVELN